jgi:hypothetical protein
MRSTAVPIVFLLLLLPTLALADEAALREHVGTLASEEMEGRRTGTDGERKAAGYLIAELEEMGAQPAPGADGFRQAFTFSAGSEDGGSTATLDGKTWTGTDAVSALSFSDNGDAGGDVVFAGYGLVTPEDSDLPYDSYHGLDVEGKVVVVLRYFPEEADDEMRAGLARYSGLRYKARHAREKGAAALLVVTGPNSPNAGETVAMGFDTAVAGSGILAGSISGELADALFSAAGGKSLADAQTALDGGNPHVSGFALEGVSLGLSLKVERRTETGYNVIAMIPGEDPDAEPLLLGAHYDHLGHGDGSSSLARKDENGMVHHGADDNASGCAAVLEIGRALVAQTPPRPVLLAFWSGEEIGLVGSEAYCSAEGFDGESIFAYLNFDMVGRSKDNSLTLQAVGSSSVWTKLAEKANVPVGFDLKLSEDPYLPTDAMSFYQAGIPTLNFFTGAHEDYHRPSDTADKVDYPDLDRVVDLGTRIAGAVLALEDRPEYRKISPRKKEGSGDRDTLRAYTGTIPDYTTEVEGLRLSGVIEGGPADTAGLQEGDVIVEFNGQHITNIYDYTYALETVKIGVETPVTVMRDGERIALTITPGTR